MAIDERARHDLYRRAAEALGPPQADTLMSLLPPVGWADVVTKDHLDQRLTVVSAELRAEMGAGDTALRTEITDLRAEVAAGDNALRAEMAAGDAGLRLEMASLRASVERGFRRQTMFIAGLMVAQWGVTAGIVQMLTS